MTSDGQNVVSVFGASDPAEGSAEWLTAYDVGRTLAELGYAVANGGYSGTMEASARGAKEAGGRAIGVTCSIWKSKPNRFIDEVVATADLHERLMKLVELGTAGYVALPGATGTLVELTLVWEMAAKRLAPPRPVVCVGEFWRPLIDLMASARPGADRWVRVVGAAGELADCFPPAKASLKLSPGTIE